jgi:YbbR domain-containing protein
MSAARDTRGRVAEWLAAEWREVLLSLLLACVIFFTVRENISNIATYPVDVEIERDPGMAVMAVRPMSVRVTFRGALSELRALDPRNLRVLVRTPRPDRIGGTVRVVLHGRNVRGRGSTRVVGLDPAEVQISFDHQGEREFAVAPPATEGAPLRGRAEVSYEPRTVRVRGARLQLDQIHAEGTRLQTEAVDVEGRAQSFVRRVRVVPPAGAWMPEILPDAVTATVTIVTERAMREFSGVPVRVAGPAGAATAGLTADPARVNLRVTGRAEALRELLPEDLCVFADVADPTAASTGAVPVRVFLPPGAAAESAVAVPDAVRLVPAGGPG